MYFPDMFPRSSQQTPVTVLELAFAQAPEPLQEHDVLSPGTFEHAPVAQPCAPSAGQDIVEPLQVSALSQTLATGFAARQTVPAAAATHAAAPMHAWHRAAEQVTVLPPVQTWFTLHVVL